MKKRSVITDEQQLERFTEYKLTLETTSSLFDPLGCPVTILDCELPNDPPPLTMGGTIAAGVF